MSVYIDTIRHVFTSDGHFLEVRPWPEAPGVLELRTTDPINEEYWGKVCVTLNREAALKLAEALRLCAEDIA
jgi:hypothetical protein